MPELGNPQALNRYAYALNNPIRYTDPNGHWVETAWDLFSIGLTLNDIRREGLTWQNGLALAVDVTAALLPVPAFAGVVLKGGKAAKAAVEMAGHADEAGEAVRVANRLDNAIDTVAAAKRLQEVGLRSNEAAELVTALAKASTCGDQASKYVLLGSFPEYINISIWQKWKA